MSSNFMAKLDHYIERKDAPPQTIGLPQLLEALGDDLRLANAIALKDGHRTIEFKEATVELDVAITYDLTGDFKVKFWVFTEAAASVDREQANTQKITVTVVPPTATTDPSKIEGAL